MNFDDICEKVVEKTDAFDVSLHVALESNPSFDFLKRAQQGIRTFQFLAHLYYGVESDKPYPETPEDEFEYFGGFPGEIYQRYLELAEEGGAPVMSMLHSHLDGCSVYLGDHWLTENAASQEDILALYGLRSEFKAIQKYAISIPLTASDQLLQGAQPVKKGPSAPGC